MRWALLAILALAVTGVGRGGEAVSAETEEAIFGLCVVAIVRKELVSAGIPNGTLEAAPRLFFCDKNQAELVNSDGSLEAKGVGGFEIRHPRGDCKGVFLGDGQITFATGYVAAWLVGSTGDYRHGILGDQLEALGFCAVGPQTGQSATLLLPPGSVFEDLRVRLVDLTGDGQAEFVVIRSYLDRGAALAVYHLVEGRIEHLAETPPIGIANRWLNPAGAADFDGDGRVEIAYVETPHIGGTLRVWELVDGKLHPEQAVAGFSNHAIGSRELDLSAVLDWNADGVPDLAVPANGRRSLRIVTFAGGTFAELDTVPHNAEIVTAILATDLDADGKPELLYGLEDGRLMLARP